MKPICIHHVGLAALAGALTSCSHPAIAPSPSSTLPSVPPPPAIAGLVAKISEIQNLPVFVRLLEATQEQPAKEGMGLHVGDTIRTQGQALAQVDLVNGLAFRIGGDAVLTLKPDNRLNLTSGDMITWVQPGKKIPTEIVTPAAVAGIRGTTVFVQIPKDPNEGTLFFAWEGLVAVHLPGQKEEVRIKPGEHDIQQIRKRVRRLSRAEWRQKRQTDRLLHHFKKAKMPTLSIINQIKPGQISLTSLVPTTQDLQTEQTRLLREADDRVKQSERDLQQARTRAEQLKQAAQDKAQQVDRALHSFE